MTNENIEVIRILKPGVISYLEKNLPDNEVIRTKKWGPITKRALITSIQNDHPIGISFITELALYKDVEFLSENFLPKKGKKKSFLSMPDFLTFFFVAVVGGLLITLHVLYELGLSIGLSILRIIIISTIFWLIYAIVKKIRKLRK